LVRQIVISKERGNCREQIVPPDASTDMETQTNLALWALGLLVFGSAAVLLLRIFPGLLPT
jgi:hypothetical protein